MFWYASREPMTCPPSPDVLKQFSGDHAGADLGNGETVHLLLNLPICAVVGFFGDISIKIDISYSDQSGFQTDLTLCGIIALVKALHDPLFPARTQLERTKYRVELLVNRFSGDRLTCMGTFPCAANQRFTVTGYFRWALPFLPTFWRMPLSIGEDSPSFYFQRPGC